MAVAAGRPSELGTGAAGSPTALWRRRIWPCNSESGTSRHCTTRTITTTSLYDRHLLFVTRVPEAASSVARGWGVAVQT